MKRLTVLIFLLTNIAFGFAAEQFIVFSSPDGSALSLKGAAFGCDAGEHKSVHIALGNLLCDMEKVVGVRPALASGTAEVLVGTVGVNSQIDKWVRQGKLADLKGKTEKYIIKTIEGRLVIAGSDKRGTEIGRASCRERVF